MKTRILFTLLLLFVATTASAALLRGKVVAADGSTPYPDVEITVLATKEIVYTDADGEFFVQDVKPGEYVVVVKTSRSKTTHKIVAQPKPVTDVRIAVQ